MGKRILVIDDDPAIVDALQMILESDGYDVVTSIDAKAIYELLHYHPQLVLLDIWMSGQDGRDICKSLKSADSTKDLPIIMISASKDIKASAYAAGADGFIAKPFDMNDLLGTVDKHLNV